MSFKLPDEMISKMNKLGENYDSITKTVLVEGAKPLFNTAKDNLVNSIGQNTKQPSKATGDLASSIRTTRPFQDNSGNWGIKVGCEGVDKKGVSNAMKAAILEYGKSNQTPRPWLKPSGIKAKKACVESMQSAFNQEVDKL